MKNSSTIPQEIIENKIYLIRGKKVMLDADLATLYEVKTKVFIQTMKRNKKRFPDNFMFQLNKAEMESWGHKLWPQTEVVAGITPMFSRSRVVAMLSSVSNSERAIQVNIQIMNTFVNLREMIISNRALRLKIEAMEKKYDKRFVAVFDAIRKLLDIHHKEPVKVIGFTDRSKNKK